MEELLQRTFKLKNGAQQGDPVSVYLFILYLEILFMLIKNEQKY